MPGPLRTSVGPALRRAGFLLLALLAADPSGVAAQYFGRNKVQYEEFEWRVLPTEHLQIHFYPEAAEPVMDAARMGERWYERFARLFQHEFESPKPLILYADHPDFQQTNTLRGSIGEGTGGVTESLKNRVIMPLAGSYADTDHVLGHELVHAFQYNIAQSRQGGGLQGLYRLPLWSIEGMAEYLSVGREDPLTAMWLRDAIRRDDFPTIEQMSREARFFPYRFGQALWAHIGGEYGDERVIQLFRRALRIGWEPALMQVLGTTSDSLSVQWRRQVAETYLPLMEGKTPPGEAGTEILSPDTDAGQQNVAPALSPDGRHVVFLSEKDLFSIDLYLADARTGEIIRKLSSANSDPHADALRFIDSSGSWSPDGERFVFVTFAEGDNELVIVRTGDGEVDRRIEFEKIGAVSNPAWSPDGRYLAFSGSKGGLTDLYLYDLQTDSIEQLTADRHADFQPTWSPDGRTIAFVSDRGPKTDFDLLTYSKPQIALYDLASGKVDPIEIFGDVKHINPQYSPDGESLFFISDQDGFSDVYRLALRTGDVFRITEVATGISGITGMSPAMTVSAETGTMVYSVFTNFQFHIYALDAASLDADSRVARVEPPQPGRLLPPTDPGFSRVADYLADASTGLVSPESFGVQDASDYEPGLQLDYVGQPSFGVSSGQFGTYVGGGAAAFFSDMLGDRFLGVSVQAQGTLKDIGAQAFYQNMKRRWNWGVAGGRIPYLQVRTGVGFRNGAREVTQIRERIFIDSFTGMLAYPFSTTRRVEGQLGFTRYSYDVEREVFLTDAFGNVIDQERESLDEFARDPLNLVSGSVALVGDNSFFAFTSPVRGGRYRLGVEQYFGSLSFTSVTADWRRYFNPVLNTTFAIRGLHFGRYGSAVDDPSEDRIRELFLGYETFIRGYAPESFEQQECPFNASTASDCPAFDRLFGNRLGVVNIEARFPLFGTEQFGLLSLPYIPTEFVLFADAGVAWGGEVCEEIGDDGNCAVSRARDVEWAYDPDTSQRVPVFSIGASTRLNILGAFVLEIYYANPLQRPDKGWHWGFQIAPGW